MTRRKRTVGITVERARRLRRAQTDAEARLWKRLRAGRLADHKFRRQHPVGPYILDFYCHEALLAIELDGGQHSLERNRESDAERDAWLIRQGVRVLRFWNHDVLRDPEAVLEVILATLRPHPDPLPEGEGATSHPYRDEFS